MMRLGNHPENGLPVFLVRSPFGMYIQYGEATEEQPRPQGCWLPAEWDARDVSLETALEFLTFPRKLGSHPVTGADVTIHLQQGVRRFAPKSLSAAFKGTPALGSNHSPTF
jgi:DNA topoisomerase-1